MTGVELADVAVSEFLQEARNCPDFWRRGQQVNVVVHQHAGVQLAARVEHCIPQHGELTASIGIIEKAGKSFIATLYNVLRNAEEVESWLSGHCLAIGVACFPRSIHGRFASWELACRAHREGARPPFWLAPFWFVFRHALWPAASLASDAPDRWLLMAEISASRDVHL